MKVALPPLALILIASTQDLLAWAWITGNGISMSGGEPEAVWDGDLSTYVVFESTSAANYLELDW